MHCWNRRFVAVAALAVLALALSSLAVLAVAVTSAPARPAPVQIAPAPRSGHPSADRATPAPKVARLAPTLSVAPAPTGAWQALGPAPIGPSVLAGGGFYGGNNSGRITAVGQIPSGSHAGRIVIGSAGGGVWTSDDGGATWTPRTDTQPDLAIGAVAIDPNNPDHIVIGTGEANQCGDCFNGNGILNSTDGGATWTRQDPGGVFDNAAIAQIAIDPTNSLREFAATSFGLYETTDGGTTWTKPTDASYTSNLDGNITGVVVDSAGTVRVASPNSNWIVSQSTDHGVTFTETDTGIAHASGGLVALAVAPGTPTTMYVSVGGFGAVAVWKNTAGGAGAWTHSVSTPDFTGQGYAYGSGSAEQGWYDNVLAVDPTNASHVVAGGIALVETTDGGTTWTNVNGQAFSGVGTNLIHPDQHALAFRADGKILIGDDGGVFLYGPAGPTVTNLQGNLNITQFYFGFSAVGGQVLAGAQDNGSAGYSGSTAWTGIFGGDGGPSAITANHSATRFIEADQKLYLTTDAFATTTLTDITPPTSGQNFTPPMIVVPSTSTPADPTVYYGGGNELWRTTNPSTGASWTNITGNVGAVSAIAVAPSDPNTIYAGLNSGTVLVSTDGGTTFNPLPTQPFDGIANFVTGLSVNPGISTELTASFSYNDTRYARGSPHIARFNGTSWSNLTGTGLPSQAVSRVVYDAGTLVAATDAGVFASTDQGATWSVLGTGFPNVQVQDLAVEPDGLYAITHGRGAWKLVVAVPGAPTGVSATAGNGRATVSFTAPSNNGSVLTGYTVTASPGGATATGSASPLTVSGLSNGMAYTFTVTATNGIGAGPASSPSSAVTPATVPDTPTGVSATAGNGRATVSWRAPVSTGGSPITGYTATANPGGAQCVTTRATSCTITGLANGRSYRFTVIARSAAGTSVRSAPTRTVTPLGVLGVHWSISKRSLVALVVPYTGARRYSLVATRAHAKSRSAVCRLTGKGRARRVRCTLTLGSGTWTLTAQAHSATSLIAHATHAVRVR